MAHTVLVLGGYGFFGARISAGLAENPSIRLLVAGRNLAKAQQAAAFLKLPQTSAVRIDASAPDLAESLGSLNVDTLIHTAGPFQGQSYEVAKAAIHVGANYVDLADGRDFVAGIGILDKAAKAKGVLVVSGASSVPGLSSAVIDQYLPAFGRLDTIRIGIGSGARAPGLATVQGVLGYCGKAIRRLEQGAWATTYGWHDLKRYEFPKPVGRRWLGSCDVPDLELFPQRYSSVRTVTFHAGFASDPGHLVVWALASLVRIGILKTAAPLAHPLNHLSRWIEPVVSDKGAMFVQMEGVDPDGRITTKRWHLVAAQNHGPYVACGASIALAQKLAAGTALPKGAQPCMGLLSLAEYLAPLKALDIREIEDTA